MSVTRAIFAQKNPNAGVLTDFYTIPVATSATTSSLFICNKGSSPATFRVSVAQDGEPDNIKQYIYYDIKVAANDTFTSKFDFPLAPGLVIRIMASNHNLIFNLFGLL